MDIAFTILLALHGLIHLMGFAKAFGLAKLTELSLTISRPAGMLWLTAGVFFFLAAAWFASCSPLWRSFALAGVVLSQGLIAAGWKDARWGTVANGLVVLALVLSWGNQQFEGLWKRDVAACTARVPKGPSGILQETDIQPLPAVVRAYIRNSGAIGKPRPKGMRVVMDGQMTGKGKAAFPFTCEQYSFFDQPARLFFMKGRMMGTSVPGYHRYMDGRAVMDIRLFGLLRLVHHEGSVMDTTELVTYFNDLCLMAPAALADPRISWEQVDSLRVRARYTLNNVSISAVLIFNERAEIADFISDDRTNMEENKRMRFSTPVHSYGSFNGMKLVERGDAVWEYPEGPFTYGQFHIREISYTMPLFENH